MSALPETSSPATFPIIEYLTDGAFSAAQRRQWNTVLSFARYLLCGRNRKSDFEVMTQLLRYRQHNMDSELMRASHFSGEPLWDSYEWQTKVGHEFAGLVFSQFREAEGRTDIIGDILNDLTLVGKLSWFDAVVLYIRYGLTFDIERVSMSERFCDGLLQPLLNHLGNTLSSAKSEGTQQRIREAEQLVYLAESISAFRVSKVFPCECRAVDNSMLETVNAEGETVNAEGKRLNSWFDFRPKMIAFIESGGEAPSTDRDAIGGGLGPLFIAWVMLAPNRWKECLDKVWVDQTSRVWIRNLLPKDAEAAQSLAALVVQPVRTKKDPKLDLDQLQRDLLI